MNIIENIKLKIKFIFFWKYISTKSNNLIQFVLKHISYLLKDLNINKIIIAIIFKKPNINDNE